MLSELSDPAPILNALKSYASKSLNRCEIDKVRSKRWARHGSTVYLWTEDALACAIRYVLELQDAPMEVFDASADD